MWLQQRLQLPLPSSKTAFSSKTLAFPPLALLVPRRVPQSADVWEVQFERKSSAVLLCARAFLSGGLAAVATTNIPALGVPLACSKGRSFESPSWRAQVQTAGENGPGVCASYGGARTEGQPRREPQLWACQPRRPWQVNAAREGGVARGGLPARQLGLCLGQGSWRNGTRKEIAASCALFSGFVNPGAVFTLFHWLVFPPQSLNFMFIRFCQPCFLTLFQSES